MYGRIPHGVAGGASLGLGILGLAFTALLTAATIIAILMLIDVARNRGVKVEGGRLAGFWIVGLVLTPITLALYVLCLKPTPAHAAIATCAPETTPLTPAVSTSEGPKHPRTPEVPSAGAGSIEETLGASEDPTTVVDGPSA